MRSRLILLLSAYAVLGASVALAEPMGATGPPGGLPTLQKLVQNLSQQQTQGLLGSPSRNGGEVSLHLQSPAASVPGGGVSMVYVPGSGFLPDTGSLRIASQWNWAQVTTPGQNLGFTSTGYDLAQTLGVSVSELGGYLYVVHVPFNIAIKDGYKDPGPADGGQPPPVIIPAPSSTVLGLLGLMMIGSGMIRLGRIYRMALA